MGKLKFLSVLLITALAFSVGNATPPITDNLQRSYTSQIGVREATGNNDGVQVEAYLKTVGLGKGYAWCAAFVKWNFKQVNIPNTINAMALSAHNNKNIVYYKNTFYKEPTAGDVFTLYYAHLRRIGHTGFY